MTFISILFLLLLLPVTSVFSQSAEEIETLLYEKTVTYEQAVRLILRAADIDINPEKDVIDNDNIEDVFSYLSKWLPEGAEPMENAKLGVLSLVIMRSFNLRGGIMYTITGKKNPRYAYRELVYKGIITGRSDPDMYVSGELLLYYINNILEKETMLKKTRKTTLQNVQETTVQETLETSLQEEHEEEK